MGEGFNGFGIFFFLRGIIQSDVGGSSHFRNRFKYRHSIRLPLCVGRLTGSYCNCHGGFGGFLTGCRRPFIMPFHK
jgi:hypothetical protein